MIFRPIGAILGGTGGMVPPNLAGWDIVACITPQNCRRLAGISSPPIINVKLRRCLDLNFSCWRLAQNHVMPLSFHLVAESHNQVPTYP